MTLYYSIEFINTAFQVRNSGQGSYQFGKFSAIICFLGPDLFLLSFQDSDDTGVRSFVIVPQIPEALFILFSTLFSLLFKLGNFYCSVWKFADSFLCSLHSDVEPIH